MNVLDITFLNKFETKIKKKFDTIANNNLTDFNLKINEIAKNHKKKLEWWLSNLASRNIFLSRLYYNYCCLILIRQLLSEKFYFDTILLDDFELEKEIHNNFNLKNIKIINVHKNNYFINKLSYLIKILYFPVVEILFYIFYNFFYFFKKKLFYVKNALFCLFY